MENLGLLDSMIAIASYRESLSYYSVPELVKQEKAFLESEDMYHPMLENPVANTIKEERGVLVTGSNASGKSTFLKILSGQLEPNKRKHHNDTGTASFRIGAGSL